MSRLEQIVNDALAEGRASGPPPDVPGAPRAVAWWKQGDVGAVLTLIQRSDGTRHRLLAVATRAPDGIWDVTADIGSPWVADGWRPTAAEGPRVIDESGAAGAVLFSGVAPSGTARIRGRLRDVEAVVDVDPNSGAFVVGFLPGTERGGLELTALDEHGRQMGTTRLVP